MPYNVIFTDADCKNAVKRSVISFKSLQLIMLNIVTVKYCNIFAGKRCTVKNVQFTITNST